MGAPAWQKRMRVSRFLPSLETRKQNPGDCEVEVPCTVVFCISWPSYGLQKHVAQLALFCKASGHAQHVPIALQPAHPEVGDACVSLLGSAVPSLLT
jgi:hypothetical protein